MEARSAVKWSVVLVYFLAKPDAPPQENAAYPKGPPTQTNATRKQTQSQPEANPSHRKATPTQTHPNPKPHHGEPTPVQMVPVEADKMKFQAC